MSVIGTDLYSVLLETLISGGRDNRRISFGRSPENKKAQTILVDRRDLSSRRLGYPERGGSALWDVRARLMDLIRDP
jgi:hypothetical protein